MTEPVVQDGHAGGAAAPESPATTVTGVGTCRCPGTPHPSGEAVVFRPAATIPMGAAAMSARRDAASADEFVGILAGIELRFGIESWTCLDGRGQLGIDTGSIAERFPWPDGGSDLAERADALYAGDLLSPLLRRIARSSQAMRTEPPTSATPPSGEAPAGPSEPSSPPDTATPPSGDPAP